MVSYIASFQALLGLGFAFGLFLLCTLFFFFIKIKVLPVLSSSPFLKLPFFQPQDFIEEDPSLILQLSPFKVFLSLMHIWMVRETKLVYFRPKLVDICSFPFQTSQDCLRSWYLRMRSCLYFLKTERNTKLAYFNPNQWTRYKTFSLDSTFKSMSKSWRNKPCEKKWSLRIYEVFLVDRLSLWKLVG